MTGVRAGKLIGKLRLPVGVPMKDAAFPEARFLVRRGSIDWMVYDRERKGPALLKDLSLAEKLTREQAEHLKHSLTTSPDI